MAGRNGAPRLGRATTAAGTRCSATTARRSRSRRDAPIQKTLRVERGVEEAFEVFTEGASRWWPFRTHSVGGEKANDVVWEGHEGGRVFERHVDGGEADWGRLLVWDPPHRVAVTWFPGLPPTDATRLEVTFAPDGTLVTLVHSGWEHCGPGAAQFRDAYEGGWEHVLGRYRQAAVVP